MYALAMGCPLDQLHAHWAQAISNRIPPNKVSRAPVKEEVHKGSTLLQHDGLREFPIPIATNGWEAFPRITAAAFFTRDPELGTTNAGMYNSIVLGSVRANIRTSRHLRNHWHKCKNSRLQVAGGHRRPSRRFLHSGNNIPDGISELDVAAVSLANPEVISCETVDIGSRRG
jgi:UbiD family decarboxylase